MFSPFLSESSLLLTLAYSVKSQKTLNPMCFFMKTGRKKISFRAIFFSLDPDLHGR